MKKLLLASLLVAGFAAFAPRAQADSYRTVFVGYDHCGRPVYERVVTHYCAPRPVVRYSAPVYHRSSSYRNYDYDRRCDSSRSYYSTRHSSSRPRFAISFGF